MRKEEVQALYGPNEFQEFYSRLKQLKDFHRKHPNEVSMGALIEFIGFKWILKYMYDIIYFFIFAGLCLYIWFYVWLFYLQISVPMSVEFDEINKMRENADETTSMCFVWLTYLFNNLYDACSFWLVILRTFINFIIPTKAGI